MNRGSIACSFALSVRLPRFSSVAVAETSTGSSPGAVTVIVAVSSSVSASSLAVIVTACGMS